MDVTAAITNAVWHNLWSKYPRETGCALAARCKWQMVLRRELLPWGRPLLMGKLALFAATPGMVAGCCYVIDVTVDSIGIELEKTDARPLGTPGSARAAAGVAHHPPVVARGPMDNYLKLAESRHSKPKRKIRCR